MRLARCRRRPGGQMRVHGPGERLVAGQHELPAGHEDDVWRSAARTPIRRADRSEPSDPACLQRPLLLRRREAGDADDAVRRPALSMARLTMRQRSAPSCRRRQGRSRRRRPAHRVDHRLGKVARRPSRSATSRIETASPSAAICLPSPADGVSIRSMTPTDVAAGLALCRASHWNQTKQDSRFFLTEATDGALVAEAGGRVIGTVATLPYGPFTWISMVLVDPVARGKHVGTTLLRRGLRLVGADATARLDATPRRSNPRDRIRQRISPRSIVSDTTPPIVADPARNP